MTNRRAQAVEDFQSSHTAQETLYTLLDMHNTMKDILRCLPTRPVDGGTPALHDPDLGEQATWTETAPADDPVEALAWALWLAYAGLPDDSPTTWDGESHRNKWLAVARAAREHIGATKGVQS